MSTIRITRPRRSGMAGISLIELMVVIAIIGIAAGLAYPSLQQYARETKRAEAHALMQRMAEQQERFFSGANAYTADLTQLGYTLSGGGVLTPEGYWRITAAATPSTFTLTATAGGNRGYADPDCDQLTIDESGTKGGLDDGGGVNNACW